MQTQDKIKAIEDKLRSLWYVCTNVHNALNYREYIHATNLPDVYICNNFICIYENLNDNRGTDFIFSNNNWFEDFNKVFDEIVNNTFGKNTVRMMKIGQVQDKLKELGFIFQPQGDDFNHIDKMYIPKTRNEIYFWSSLAYFRGVEYYYNSPTFETDLLNKAKELISD